MAYQFSKRLMPKVLDGTKTMTRRPYKDGDHIRDLDGTAVYRNGRKHWAVGQRYAIQPGRGVKGVGFIEVTKLRYDGDVRDISAEDAKAEGFESRLDFVAFWCSLYDEKVILEKLDKGRWSLLIAHPARRKEHGSLTIAIKQIRVEVIAKADQILELIKRHRPEKLYRAWVSEFCLVTEQVPS